MLAFPNRLKDMNIEDTKTEAKKLLIKHYNLKNPEDIPERRQRSKWTRENKFGFLLGIINHGQDFLVTELYNLLQQEDFKNKETAAIDKMYDFHIKVFKQHNGTGSSCHTPSSGGASSSSASSSRNNSVEDMEYEKILEHTDLKKAVKKRDVVCLFCWDKIQCEAAHIVAQKEVPFPYSEPTLFERTGLEQKHQVQNGLLLCVKCHREFDALKRYVDVVDDKLVVKVVNETNDTTSDNHQEWLDAKEVIIFVREGQSRLKSNLTCKDGRKAAEAIGEMALYFVDNNLSKLPNRKALEFHKTACLIWRMAGGAESDEESCPDNDDDYIAMDYRLKDIQKWRENSSATLATE